MDGLPPELIEEIFKRLQPTASQPYNSVLFQCISLSKSISPIALLLLYRSIHLHHDRQASRLIVASAFGSEEYPTLKLHIYGDLYEGMCNEELAKVLDKCSNLVDLTIDGMKALDSRFLQNSQLKNLKRLVLDTRFAEHPRSLNVHFALQHLSLASTPIPPALLTAIYAALGIDGLYSLRLSSLATFRLEIIDRFLLRSITPKLRKLHIDNMDRPQKSAAELGLIAEHCPRLVELHVGSIPPEYDERIVKLDGHETTLRVVFLSSLFGFPPDDISEIDVVLQTPYFKDLHSLTLRVHFPDNTTIVTPYWRTRLAEMEARKVASASIEI